MTHFFHSARFSVRARPSRLGSPAWLSLVLAVLVIVPGSLFAGTLPVQTGVQLWLSTDTLNTSDTTQVQVRNGNSYVAKWLDQSPNHYNAVQSVADKQPQFVPVYQGLPIVRFDGVNDFLTTGLPQIAGNKSIFIVEKRIGTSWRPELGSSTITTGQFLGNVSGTESAGRLNVATDLTVPGLNNSMVFKCLIRSGPTTTLQVNDNVVSGTNVPEVSAGTYTLSSAWPNGAFFGAIQEIIVYNRAVSEPERQQIENYLSEKWSLWATTLPVQQGLRLWLAADAINPGSDTQQVRIASTGTFVSYWPDRSTTASTSQSATPYQPKYTASGLNGRPVVTFDGINDFMSTPLAQISGDKSFFLVHRRTSNAVGCEIASSSASGGLFLGSNNGYPASAQGPYTEGKGRFGVAFDLQVPMVLNQFVIKAYLRSGSLETLQVNNSLVNATVAGDAVAGNYTLSDSHSFPFSGDLAEVVMYNRALSASESQAVEDYLQDKWSNTADNVFSVAPDLTAPAMTVGTPAPGVRVQQTSPEYAGTNVYHTIYLPRDWQPGRTYPVIVDYAGNGPYSDGYGDTNTGNVEGASFGYGVTGGVGAIWVCMPCIGGTPLTNQPMWWGDVNATKDYCLKTVRHVCEDWGGDPSAVIIAGFSRGSIACNYLGLSDDTIADIWLAFIPHAHYDGQIQWGYPGDDAASAYTRLLRLKGRAQHLSHEVPLTGTEAYLRGTGIDCSQITFRTLPFSNHTDLWTLRPIQLRRDTRAWLQQVLITRPGTHAISGKVTQSDGVTPIAGARVQSGYTHFTFTAADGSFTLASLIDSSRTVTVTASGFTFSDVPVTVSGANVTGLAIKSN